MTDEASSEFLSRGQLAIADGDWAAARACFEQALAQDDSIEALDGLGQALQWLGEFDAAIEARERAFKLAREAGRPLEASDQARWLAFLHGAVHGNFTAAGGWFGRAASQLEGLDEAPQHGWLALDRTPLVDSTAERLALAEQALRVGRRFGDTDLEFGALALVGESHVYSGRVAEGMRMLDEAMTAVSCGEVTGVVTIGDIYCRLLSACERASDARRAEEWLSVVDRFSDRSGYVLVSATCRAHYGGILTQAGRWDAAEEELLAALRLSERSYRAVRSFPIVRLAELRVRQGRFEEAKRLVEGTEWHPLARRALAAVALAQGELGLASELVALCLEADERSDPACAPALDLLVDIELARGDREAAAASVERLGELAERSGDERAGAYARFATGRLDRSAAELQAAIQAFSSLELPFEAARAELALARVLADGAPEAAGAEARTALRAFEQLGAARQADTAAALLRELGAGGRAAPRGDGALTRREREVLALLADGLSNAEIADRLVISRRTAEHHVASVLSKLGLRSRAEAAAHAVRSQERPVAG
jgi:DNA-binding CsgD family transcriptional regulator